MQVQTHTGPAWKQVLRPLLSDVCAPSYQDATAVLERELGHCDTLYMGVDDAQRTQCFAMAAWAPPAGFSSATSTAYVGLTVARDSCKGSGAFRELYRAINRDAKAIEERTQSSLCIWLTTASASIYFGATLAWHDVEPRLDGRYSDDGEELARQIRCAFYPAAPSQRHPFVLAGVATGTRYSDAESERVAVIKRRHDFRLLEELGVNEGRGDRLLLVCRPRR
jgi:hypothetical protein